jgi:large subunit ribosomal protein L15
MTFKRRKSTRYRGTHTHGRGFKKKARGSGHRGGFGMSGIENQKKTAFLNLYGNNYFGSDKALRKPVRAKPRVINLDDLERNMGSYISEGIAKETKNGIELDLKKTKILGDGNIKSKLIINAWSASKSAVDKIKKAGGSITVKVGSDKKAEEEKPAKAEKKDVKAK